MRRQSGIGYKSASTPLCWLRACLLRYLGGGSQTAEHPLMPLCDLPDL
jgi:hypothetical protein